jgi:hypothetical protein
MGAELPLTSLDSVVQMRLPCRTPSHIFCLPLPLCSAVFPYSTGPDIPPAKGQQFHISTASCKRQCYNSVERRIVAHLAGVEQPLPFIITEIADLSFRFSWSAYIAHGLDSNHCHSLDAPVNVLDNVAR